jgi:DNA binding domain, excisionase family
MAKRTLYPSQTHPPHLSDTPRWLSPAEAAEYLGCSKNFLDKDRQSRTHGIPYSRLGRYVRYDRHELDAYLEGNKSIRANK